MSRRIACPHCGKQLTVTPEFAGKKVACPRCAKQFRVSLSDSDEPSSVLEVAPRNPNLFPPAEPSVTPNPEATPKPEATNKPEAKKPRFKEPPKQSSDADGQTARFIEPDPNATNVKLGEDGRLPDLALASRQKRADSTKETPSSNPLVLIAVLCFSVLMSVLILLIDEPSAGRAAGKDEARARIEVIFTSFDSWERQDGPARDVRDLLARALQAYNRGDLQQEKKYYRRVLDLLNREDAPRYGGFSGNDRELEELLGELLR